MSKSTYFFLFIIFLGFFLRVFWINQSPPSLYGDELTIALDSNSILHTGRDQLGNFFPLTFQMGAGRPAGYVYGSIPFVAIFGTTAMGVRGLSILSGIGIIILLFLICRQFSPKVGLAAAFIAALSPWNISLSRGGFEAHFALFLAILGTYLFIKARDIPLLYIFSALNFGLTLHTYPTYKVSLLFFLPILLWYTRVKAPLAGRKYFLSGVIIFLTLGLIALSQTFIGGSEKRFADINIFSKDDLKEKIEQKINLERTINNLPLVVSQFFHNKPTEYTKVFIENYLQNFSIDFLILHGDRNPRHNMATIGETFLAEGILAIIGFLYLWQKHKRIFILVVLWLILAPIPTALVDFPHALRSSFMLPPLIILSSFGLTKILEYKNKLFLVSLGIIFAVQFIFFVQKLYFLAPNEYSSFWSYPAKAATEYALESKAKYSYIILADNIDSIQFAYPVYAKVSPSEVLAQNNKLSELNGFRFRRFDNVYIGSISKTETQKFLDRLEGSYVYLGPPDLSNYLKSYQLLIGTDDTHILSKTQK